MSCSISRLTSTLASFVHPCCIYLHIIHAFGKACCPECALEHEVRYLLRSQPPKKNMNALCWNTVVLKYCWMLGCKDAVAFSSFRWNRQKTSGCQRNLTFGTNGLKARCGFPKVKKHYAYIYITVMYSHFALSISASNVWACVIYKCPYVRLWRVHVWSFEVAITLKPHRGLACSPWADMVATQYIRDTLW